MCMRIGKLGIRYTYVLSNWIFAENIITTQENTIKVILSGNDDV